MDVEKSHSGQEVEEVGGVGCSGGVVGVWGVQGIGTDAKSSRLMVSLGLGKKDPDMMVQSAQVPRI